MPSTSVSIMENRPEFVRLAHQGSVSVAALCRRFGISRQTGFTCPRRRREEGGQGLGDRSRRPNNRPKRCAEAMETQVLALRAASQDWGGRRPRSTTGGRSIWRQSYNKERPGEALDLEVPARRYRASPVCFPEV